MSRRDAPPVRGLAPQPLEPARAEPRTKQEVTAYNFAAEPITYTPPAK
jgi:hypothetical protein